MLDNPDTTLLSNAHLTTRIWSLSLPSDETREVLSRKIEPVNFHRLRNGRDSTDEGLGTTLVIGRINKNLHMEFWGHYASVLYSTPRKQAEMDRILTRQKMGVFNSRGTDQL